MTITFSDELLRSAKLTEAELKVELAVVLFQQERLTLAQAATLAGCRYLDFQTILAERKISIHYSAGDLEQDLALVQKRLTR